MGLLVILEMSFRCKRSAATFMSADERFGTGRHMGYSDVFSEKVVLVERSLTLVTLWPASASDNI